MLPDGGVMLPDGYIMSLSSIEDNDETIMVYIRIVIECNTEKEHLTWC